MSRLFETTDINGMTLRNRFIRSATWEGMAEETGECSTRLINEMARLAPQDPEFVGPPGPYEYAEIGGYDPALSRTVVPTSAAV